MTELRVEREVVVERPAGIVFDAWLDPTKVVQWISAQATETPKMVSEPKVGGDPGNLANRLVGFVRAPGSAKFIRFLQPGYNVARIGAQDFVGKTRGFIEVPRRDQWPRQTA